MAMARRAWLEAGTGLLIAGLACVGARAQQMQIGSVSTLDATVTGASSIGSDRALLGMNGTVVAKDHVAYVQLYRGGSVKVCATSGVHLTAGVPVAADAKTSAGLPVAGAADSAEAGARALAPLLVALDRGAMEIRMAAVPGDMVMTPDLRVGFSGDGQLDLHIRVTRNGDTCVENRVVGLGGHPELRVDSLFGNESYNVMPGQHILFEGGNLREVVDNESSPCGCPEAAAKPLSAGGAGLRTASAPKTPAARAEAEHPFPAAVSQGLAPPPPVPQAEPGAVHTEIAATLVYNQKDANQMGGGTAPAKRDAAPSPPAPAGQKGFFHSVGRFFRRIF